MIAPMEQVKSGADRTGHSGTRTDQGFRILYERANGIGGSAARVFAQLHSHANAAGQSRPPQQAIAQALHLSVRTVRRATRALERAGIIATEPGTGHKATRYRVHYPTIDRGHSPVENKPDPRKAPERPQKPRGGSAPKDPLGIFRDAERLKQAAQDYNVGELLLIYTLQRARNRDPRNLGAYFQTMIARHRSGEQPLIPGDQEDMMDARSAFRGLRDHGRRIA